MYDEFKKELTALLNRHCIDDLCGTPDFILSQFIFKQLSAYSSVLEQNKAWHGWIGLERAHK